MTTEPPSASAENVTPDGSDDAPSRDGGTSRRRRGWALMAMLIAWGVRLATLPEQTLARLTPFGRILMVLPLLAAVPVVARPIAALASRVRMLRCAGRAWLALAFALVGTFWLCVSTLHAGKRFVPLVKDEYSYLLQARMLTVGRLWMPRHPLADFFETTAVITDRVYASVYTPGNALLHAPGVAMGVPPWMTAALLTAATIALLFLVVAKLLDEWAACGACVLFVACGTVQWCWRFVLAQIPAALFGLLLISAFLRWRGSDRRLRWASAMGAIAGWALLIRPQDAVCYILPVAIGMLLEAKARPRRTVSSMVACVVAAAPLLALQLVVNAGVTGRLTDFPHAYYFRRDLPGLGHYGFRPPRRAADPGLPASVSPQKQAEFVTEYQSLRRLDSRNRGDWLHVWNFRLPAMIDGMLPHPWIAVFLPVGLLALRGAPSRCLLAAPLLIWFLVYLPWPIISPHYPVAIAPAGIFLVVAGVREIERHAGRWSFGWMAFGSIAIIAAATVAQPPFLKSGALPDPEVISPSDIDAMVHKATDRPAVVLLRYGSPHGPKMRPFNLDVAWPDDAPIIKALDLGPRNGDIVRYYAQRQPARRFFLFDFTTANLTPFGDGLETSTSRSPQEAKP